ncbi:MAG: sigma-54 dependent transcriptional regulator [Gemmatimonadota bacterium]
MKKSSRTAVKAPTKHRDGNRKASSNGDDPSIPHFQFGPEEHKTISILIVDDEDTLRETCANVLRAEGYNVVEAGRGEEALELARNRVFDLAIIDLYMQQVPGLELLRASLETNPGAIVIMMTGHPSIESSLEALRAGAWDYLPKPFSATQLQILVGRATHAVIVARETAEIRQKEEDTHSHSEQITILGNSPAFRRAVDVARRVAQTDASVFITGESGTGKELIAQLIHHESRRSSRQLVPVNCAAIPETLMESEMFGHSKGAFTGAVREKPGLLETANGGTLFLDELAEMPLAIQAKLLRVIQDGVVRRLGANSESSVVNVRFIAATNGDPQDALQKGQLRKDLYYRLMVVPIYMPPLRARVEDIPLLARHFLAHYWTRYRRKGEPIPTLTDAAVRTLQARPWHGNVRELQNVIEHAVVLFQPGSEVLPGDIPTLDMPGGSGDEVVSFSRHFMEQEYHPARDHFTAEFERGYLTQLVRRAGGNISEAARLGGVDRTTLYRLMQKHNVDKDELLERDSVPETD